MIKLNETEKKELEDVFEYLSRRNKFYFLFLIEDMLYKIKNKIKMYIFSKKFSFGKG